MAHAGLAKIRFEYNFNAYNGLGRAHAFLETGPDPFNPAASCEFYVEVPGKPGQAPEHNVQSGRRRAFLYIHRLDNFVTQDAYSYRKLSDAERPLVHRLGHRLLCFLVRKLLDDEFLTRNSLMILIRGDDLYDKKLEDYYKSMGFESYSTYEKGYDKKELFSYRAMESMEVPVGRFLLNCRPAVATHLRRKATKRDKPVTRTRTATRPKRGTERIRNGQTEKYTTDRNGKTRWMRWYKVH